jgi:pilus assembly protein Flp/PilA
MAPIGFLRTITGRFVADERGATAIEYGLMVALIGMTIMATIVSVGSGIKTTLYGSIVNALTM